VERLHISSLRHPRVPGLQRDTEVLEDQPLTRAHRHGAVLAAFPRKRMKNGSRAKPVATEDINRERATLEPAFSRWVLLHPEQLFCVRLSVVKADVLRLSVRVAACP
jgi:hypothetical protein